MAYDEEILRRARQRFEAARQERRETLEERRQNAYRREPRLRAIEAELRKTSAQILSAALRHDGDPMKALEKLRETNLKLQAEKKTLLGKLHLPLDYLSEQPACPICKDSGYEANGRMCKCLREYCAKEQKKDLSKMLDLGTQSFENFSLDWYSSRKDRIQGMSPRENMEDIFQYCKDYARTFGPESENLFFFGPTGLGKTFLSAAIAREVSAAGYSVLYDSAERVFRQMEAVKFDREDADTRSVRRIFRCDLLIVDDLGTEKRSDFVTSALYQIVNTRLIERRPTILNTNRDPKALAGDYSPQIASRIKGEYQIFSFFGEDIRDLRKAKENSKGTDGHSLYLWGPGYS